MKMRLTRKTALGVGLAIVCLPAWAGPLQRADIPAEPTWVLHLDCDALRPTTIGQGILAELAKPETEQKLAGFEALFKLDLRTQLHGLTLYSTGSKPSDGVLLMYADVNAPWLIALAKAAGNYQGSTHNQHEIHSWIDNHHAHGKSQTETGTRRLYASAIGNRIVIFGQREERVAEALDVLDRLASNLAGSANFPQLGAATASAFLQGTARKLNLPDSAPNAQIFRLTKQIRLQLGESNQKLNGVLNLDANDQDVASQINSILQGLVALIKLQADKQDAATIANAISVKQDGASVSVQLTLPASEVVSALSEAGAGQKAREHENDK